MNHSDWTLAAVDDVIARGRMLDWLALRDAIAANTEVRARVLKLCQSRLTDRGAQRYHFWNEYVKRASP